MDVAKFGLPAALLAGRLTMNADVICPQLESDLEWDPIRTRALLVELRGEFMATALVGFSLGALGVCDALARFGPVADLHVAIAPRSRDGVSVSQQGTKFLSIAGERDRWPQHAQYMQDLRAQGAEVQEVVLAGEGHFISETALRVPACVESLSLLGICLTWQPD